MSTTGTLALAIDGSNGEASSELMITTPMAPCATATSILSWKAQLPRRTTKYYTHTQPVHQLSMSELHVAPMQPSGVVHTLPATAAARVALVYRTQPCDAMGLVVLLGELARTKPAVKALVNVLILMLQLASTISNLTGAAVFIPIDTSTRVSNNSIVDNAQQQHICNGIRNW
jgi:hypothetical protein